MPLNEPTSFSGAREHLEGLTNLPLGLNSRDIALKIPAEIRQQAFFSANVTSAAALETLREYVEKVATGEINYTTARAEIRQELAKKGFGWADTDSAEDRDITSIVSTSRLDLVLRQNVAMVHARAARQVSEHEAVVEIFPNYKYFANTDRHGQFDGMVLPKSDPFWSDHYPPLDYRCDCAVFDEAGEPNAAYTQDTNGPAGQTGRLVYNGRTVPVTPPSSGYLFRSAPGPQDPPDFSLIKDDDLRRQVTEAFADRFPVAPPPDPEPDPEEIPEPGQRRGPR